MLIVGPTSHSRRDYRCRVVGPFVVFRVCSLFLSTTTRRGGERSDRRRAGPLMGVRSLAGSRWDSRRRRRQADDICESRGYSERVLRPGVSRCPQQGSGGEFRRRVTVRLPPYGERVGGEVLRCSQPPR